MTLKTRNRLICLCSLLLNPRAHAAVAILSLTLFLGGCASVRGAFDAPTPLHDIVTVRYVLTDDLPYGTHGVATCVKGSTYCTVRLRKSSYPKCLLHETRHAFEGNWHAGRESDEDCFQE